MSEFIKAILKRALWTFVEVVPAAALTAIGSATTLGEVDWKTVASTAILAGIISVLKSFAIGVPEAPRDLDPSNGHPPA